MAVIQASRFTSRLFSTLPQTRNAIQHLKERSIIEAKGPDAPSFIQGLITNDIQHVADESSSSMFTMFLNTKGRVLFDALIYKSKEAFWIECDAHVSEALRKHLTMYKVRRKVDIESLNEMLDVHVVYKGNIETTSLPICYENLNIFKDPRVPQLGYRVISCKQENVQKSLSSLIDCDESSDYKKLRYSLGVGEGVEDLPLGNCFPLESNCDYLHGVSFHKGCYIGQELTARTHHTGVVRKRLMPLFFSKVPTELPENGVIMHNNVNLGKLRGIEGDVGLALLRVDKALEFGTLTIGNGEAKVVKPSWWPIELPKEKLNVPA